MQLSSMSRSYSWFLVLLGLVFLAVAWVYEKMLALPLARFLGVVIKWITGHAKTRKQYKVIQEDLRKAGA